ncbi:MAG TPA: UDP-N-acetylmuramoyl-L-alanyl-D-glutamate--2,6-diaminopimelate ligase [Burkholderiales bacterium]|nr:UDP-N-acetylmuramoyl-L-alanyl-D-glutamate--2,6-diaminopimelate ligase [Burkholderiales bacterium]
MAHARDLLEALRSQGAMIERLSADSRRCAPGVAFLAYPGESADGRAHIDDALRRGAAAVLWEQQGFSWRAGPRVPNVAVRGLRERAGELASELYGAPSRALWMCGVTGTNGKTTCSQWIAASLEHKGVRTGVLGTLGAGFPGRLEPLANTTPDAVEVHASLKKLRDEGARAAVMEVSSHGLVQGRVNGVAFDCALFTNLSHDHLDYHGTMERYAEAKGRLFDTPGLGTAVLNLDDFVGVRLAKRLGARGLRTIGYSLSPSAVAPGSVSEFVAAAAIEENAVLLASSWGERRVAMRQLTRFGVSNALGVLGCLVAYGLPFDEAAECLERLPAVPGRMEPVLERPLVVVDYAHTPDALEKVLLALRPLAHSRGGRLVAVFGAGGDRDPAKRPVMGAVAARLAERVVLTSDNPRSEDPIAIIGAIAEGMDALPEVEPDRSRAIEQALAQSDPADVVLIAGKGHESYQEFAGRRLPFSDREAVLAAAAKMGAAQGTRGAGTRGAP